MFKSGVAVEYSTPKVEYSPTKLNILRLSWIFSSYMENHKKYTPKVSIGAGGEIWIPPSFQMKIFTQSVDVHQ